MNKIKEKIQKLMALAEGATNEHEAASAMSKAIGLMQKYQIEHTDLNKPVIVTVETKHTKQKFSSSDANLWGYITRAIGVYYVYRQGGNGDKGINYLTGLECDIELCIYIYEVIMRQINNKTAAYKKQKCLTTRQANSYRLGLVYGFGQRFVEQNKEAQQNAPIQISSTGQATGLVSISTKIKQAEDFFLLDNEEPETSSRRSNGAGYGSAGVRDSSDISYNKGVKGSGQQKQVGGY